MITQRIELHPVTPQRRLLEQAARVLRDGGLAALPTDAGYALACPLEDKAAVDRLRAIRGIDERHLLTLACRDLSDLARNAKVGDTQYRFLKRWTPGPYTFVLPATREVPRRLMHPSRKTVGLRVPDHPALQGLLEALGEPVLVTTMRLAGDEDVLGDPGDIFERLNRRIELVLDAGPLPNEPTTIVDMTGGEPVLTREGQGADAIRAELG